MDPTFQLWPRESISKLNYLNGWSIKIENGDKATRWVCPSPKTFRIWMQFVFSLRNDLGEAV